MRQHRIKLIQPRWWWKQAMSTWGPLKDRRAYAALLLGAKGAWAWPWAGRKKR